MPDNNLIHIPRAVYGTLSWPSLLNILGVSALSDGVNLASLYGEQRKTTDAFTYS